MWDEMTSVGRWEMRKKPSRLKFCSPESDAGVNSTVVHGAQTPIIVRTLSALNTLI